MFWSNFKFTQIMKNFIIFLCLVISMFFMTSCNSCNNDVKFGIEYDLSTNGSTDAAVSVTFNGGHFTVDGAAKFDFDWTNVSPMVFQGESVYGLDSALASNDAKVVEAAKRVDDWLNKEVYVSDFTGHYDIYVKGYVKETLTGLKFEIDRHFTNLSE